jgi:predicted lysophospholipase L1 biosynthesis ABC-type transport system permease subunit
VFIDILFFLILLSVMLIYSLMVADVESKQYEMGMLRALGLKQISIIFITGVQSMVFSLPGIIFGLLISSFVNVIIVYIIYTYSYSEVSYLILYSPILIGIAVGLFIPMASNILPIKKALSKTIRDALDIYHSQVSDLTVSITKLSSFGFSPFQTVLGFVLSLAGIVCYYLIPSSFLFREFQLFFVIVNLLLLGMLLGLCFLCFLFFNPLQKLLVHFFLLIGWKDRKLKKVVMKNLESHSKRNSKTSIMFTIALAFLIFSGTAFSSIQLMIVNFI